MPGDASGWLPAAAMPAALSHYRHTHVCSHAWLPAAARLLSADRAALRLAWIQQANRAM
jgi:hypothetical protein